MLKNWSKLYWLWAMLFALYACQPSADEVVPQVLVSATQVAEADKASIDTRIPGLPLISTITRAPVRAVRLVYQTQDTEGRTVQASGLLLLPRNPSTPLPLLSYQHATIEDDREAPSYYAQGGEAWSLGTVLASTGYAVAMPDYLGYGASNQLPHPYEHAASLASASLDMLRAAKEYCSQQNIGLNNKLFLTGYSLGGSATMALHKYIQERATNEFTVTASAPGAGAYHKTAFSAYIMNSTQDLRFVNTYLRVLDTYNRVYKINRTWAEILQAPFAAQVQANGYRAQVSLNPQQLFAPNFANGIRSGSDRAFVAAFADNDLHDWLPRAPIIMFHGTADDFVPVFNSRNALNAMRARGATNVELREIPNADHFTAVQQYALGVYFAFAPLL